MNGARTQVSLSAYNNGTDRHNVLNQTDVTGTAAAGRARHTLLAGAEFGRPATGNVRQTGYFGAAGATTLGLAAVYAQDQLALTGRRWRSCRARRPRSGTGCG